MNCSIFFEREKIGRERREYKVGYVGKEGGSGKSCGMNISLHEKILSKLKGGDELL